MKVGMEVTETVTAGIKKLNREQHRRAVSAITKGMMHVKDKAKNRLKWRTSKAGPGGRATGALQQSIHDKTTAKPNAITGEVSTKLKYAQYVEGYPKPPRRHFVPFRVAPGLRSWAKRHNLPGRWWGQSSKGMIVGGPKSSTPFLRPAFKENVKKIHRDIEKALRPR